MNFARKMIFAVPLALAMACGGSSDSGTSGNTGGSTDAFAQAAPSYAALSIDQASTDTSTSASVNGAVASALLEPDASGSAVVSPTDATKCHPHLFLRTREAVERLNRHIYKALRHVDALIATNALDTTTTSKTWERVDGGVDRKFTITLVSPNVYAWELDVGAAGTAPLPVAMTGQIDRTGAAGPNQGTGKLHIDFGVLHAAYPSDRAAQGSIDVVFDTEATKRKLTVTAASVAWDLDAAKLESASVVAALSAPRSGTYVYFREPGKGGSLEIHDQMVFACPANPALLPADVQLVSRWYVSNGTVHGRSDALMQNGQLTGTQDAKVVGVTCHEGTAEGHLQVESYWLMKAEKADGSTDFGYTSKMVSNDPAACDAQFLPVPTLTDASNDFTGWPASYSDGTPFPFPGM